MSREYLVSRLKVLAPDLAWHDAGRDVRGYPRASCGTPGPSIWVAPPDVTDREWRCGVPDHPDLCVRDAELAGALVKIRARLVERLSAMLQCWTKARLPENAQDAVGDLTDYVVLGHPAGESGSDLVDVGFGHSWVMRDAPEVLLFEGELWEREMIQDIPQECWGDLCSVRRYVRRTATTPLWSWPGPRVLRVTAPFRQRVRTLEAR